MALIIYKSCQKKKSDENSEVESQQDSERQKSGVLINHSSLTYMGVKMNLRQRESQECSERQKGQVLINQSLAYMVALGFTWLWILIQYYAESYEIVILNSIFFPLQGFWNLLIFLYDKTFQLRQTDPELKFLQAVKKIIESPSAASMIVLSDLSRVRSATPDFPGLNMENLSYSERKEESAENNLSVYDSISDYRNNHSVTKLALPDGQDSFLAIRLSEEEISNANDSHDDDKNSTCNHIGEPSSLCTQ
jgi:hypothetical protein